MDPSDEDVTVTALREANEEIGLPLDRAICPLIHLVTLPFCLAANCLFVSPVVYFMAADFASILPLLRPNPSEVDAIFHWPLLDFLLEPGKSGNLAHTFVDIIGPLGRLWRGHEFAHELMPSATTGLTADVLITVALMATGLDEPFFDWHAPNQLTWRELVENALQGRVGGPEDQRFKLRQRRPSAS